MFEHIFKRIPGQVMNFGTRQLLMQAADHRCGKHNIPDGTQPDDQQLMHPREIKAKRHGALKAAIFAT